METNRFYRLFLTVALALIATASFAQNPFWSDIQKFREQDQRSAPPKSQIVFAGSSSFTLWKDVAAAFPEHQIINRGFGGSSLPDLIRYADDVILQYQPKQVVIYCGENDLAGNEKLPADSVVNRFKTLFAKIRKSLPDAAIAYVSMKPSPSRVHLLPKFESANRDIKHFLNRQKNTAYINVYDRMMEKGQPKAEIFTSDKLHMNAAGYEIWKAAITGHLLK